MASGRSGAFARCRTKSCGAELEGVECIEIGEAASFYFTSSTSPAYAHDDPTCSIPSNHGEHACLIFILANNVQLVRYESTR
jgi:hypothetical protein